MGALLGEGPAIQLQIDAGRNPFEGGLDVRWEDFRASQNTWRRTHDRDLYSLSFDPEPTVWLNERHQELQALLHDEASTGISSLVRNTLLAYVKEGVWSSLFRAAVSVIERDPETGAVAAPTGWQETVLTMLLPHMYPEESRDAEQFERLASALEEADASADVEVRLRSAVQALSDSSESVRRLLRKAGDQN